MNPDEAGCECSLRSRGFGSSLIRLVLLVLLVQTYTAVYYVLADLLMLTMYTYYKLRNRRAAGESVSPDGTFWPAPPENYFKGLQVSRRGDLVTFKLGLHRPHQATTF